MLDSDLHYIFFLIYGLFFLRYLTFFFFVSLVVGLIQGAIKKSKNSAKSLKESVGDARRVKTQNTISYNKIGTISKIP